MIFYCFRCCLNSQRRVRFRRSQLCHVPCSLSLGNLHRFWKQGCNFDMQFGSFLLACAASKQAPTLWFFGALCKTFFLPLLTFPRSISVQSTIYKLTPRHTANDMTDYPVSGLVVHIWHHLCLVQSFRPGLGGPRSSSELCSPAQEHFLKYC